MTKAELKDLMNNVVKSERFNDLFAKAATKYFEEYGFSSDIEENKKDMIGLKTSMLMFGALCTMETDVYEGLRK